MTIPYPFQLKAVRKLHRLGGRGLLGHDMGLGKTFSSLLYAYRNPDDRPVIVVCPASLKWNWEREAVKHFRLRGEVLEGTRPKAERFLSRHRLVIVNYDILWAWLEHLRGLRPQLVIIDESQYCGSPRSRRTKAVAALCEGVPKVIALSGTPLVNNPIELWPTLNILRPDLFPSWWRFAHRFCAPKRAPWGWTFNGASRLDELHEVLNRECMDRRLKQDVLKELPRRRRVVIPLEVPRREYQHALDDFLDWLREVSPKKVKRAARAEALVKIGYLLRLVGKLKRKGVIDWIEQFLTGSSEKLIVFAVHRKVIARLAMRWPRESVTVDGSVTGRKRQLALDRFLKDPKIRLLFGNIKAAGVGWSARGVSSTAFVELPWTPGVLIQAMDRTHGIGRGEEGKRSTSWLLVARDTVEEKLLKLLQRKQRTASAVLDGGEDRGERLDVFDELVRVLKAGDKS